MSLNVENLKLEDGVLVIERVRDDGDFPHGGHIKSNEIQRTGN